MSQICPKCRIERSSSWSNSSSDTILAYTAIIAGMTAAYLTAYIARQKIRSLWAKVGFLVIASVAGIASFLVAMFLIGFIGSFFGLTNQDIASMRVCDLRSIVFARHREKSR
jgi:hypothetical protein